MDRGKEVKTTENFLVMKFSSDERRNYNNFFRGLTRTLKVEQIRGQVKGMESVLLSGVGVK